MQIKLNTNLAKTFILKHEIDKLSPYLEFHHKSLVEKTGVGNEFLGWLDLPYKMLDDKSIFNNIEQIKKTWSELQVTHIVVIGIGGSYLGIKAIYEALSIDEKPNNNSPKLIFAGHHISAEYLNSLTHKLAKTSYAVVVISKSGTTLEPALAFRVVLNQMEKQFNKKEIADRVVAITDKSKGALRQLAEENSWKSFIIEDDIGGRFSVLSPVGLVPLMLANVNVISLLNGAFDAQKLLISNSKLEENIALQYAALRYLLYNAGKPVEMLVSFNPQLQYFAEWWKQLFGESEGKNNKGIFPSSAIFSTDLHSMGQYIQDGLRILFETYITVENSNCYISVPFNLSNVDELNYLCGKEISEINLKAAKATMLAHHEGNVPVIEISIPYLDEYNLGSLIYFFEFACAINCYLLEVNPFNQPGVEAYKLNMFALLGKPGMEKETKDILIKINNNVD